MIECNLENIDKKFILNNNNKTLKVIINDLDFYFKLSLKDNQDKLLVFSNGAINTDLSTPPIFMRSKWADDFNSNCLYIDDRTIHNNNLKIGWGVGTINRHYLVDYIKFVTHIRQLLEINQSNTVYYGSSAGGFMSIAMSAMDRGTMAIVNNPQTYVHKYNKSAVDALFENVFPNQKSQEVIKNYGNRLSLVNIMSSYNNVPRVWYLQNRLCKGDMLRHYAPLCENLDKYKINSSNINFLIYNNLEDGHNPLNRSQTSKFINNVLDKNTNIIF